MADSVTDLQTYEVLCPNCKVTFPPETKVCVHCGARLGRGGIPSAVRPASGGPRGPADSDARPIGLDMDDDEELERRGSSPLRFASSLVWIGLFLLYTVVRACSER